VNELVGKLKEIAGSNQVKSFKKESNKCSKRSLGSVNFPKTKK